MQCGCSLIYRVASPGILTKPMPGYPFHPSVIRLWAPQNFKLLISAPAVNFEIGIQREDSLFVVDLGAPDQAGVGQRDRPIFIFAENRFDSSPVFRQRYRDPIKSLFSEGNDLSRTVRVNFSH